MPKEVHVLGARPVILQREGLVAADSLLGLPAAAEGKPTGASKIRSPVGKMNLREEIIKIITYHGDEGTSGYLLSETEIGDLVKLFRLFALECVGEDEFDPESSGIQVWRFRNEVKQKIRKKIEEAVSGKSNW